MTSDAVRRPAARACVAELARRRARPASGLRRRRPRPRRGPARGATTSRASPPSRADARGQRRLRRPARPAWSPASASPRWSSTTSWATTVTITDRVADGTRVDAGDVVMRVAGPTRGLLTAERTALNFACHLSGVATATAHWVAGARGHPRPGARHPQDAARLPRAAEVRRALRRRRQPPVQPQRPGDGQGQPRRRRRRRGAGVRGRAGGLPRTSRRGRGHRPRPAARAARRGLHRILLDNMDDATMAEAVAHHRRPGRASRPPAG